MRELQVMEQLISSFVTSLTQYFAYFFIADKESFLTTINATENRASGPAAMLENNPRASLVAQWLGICLPMQATRVRALVWEDPTCCRATGPVSHNY